MKPSEFRMYLSTLTDEELRRKMDTFNELFVTVGNSMCSGKFGVVWLSVW